MSDFSHIDALFSAEEESCLSLESMQDYAVGKLPAVQVHAVERHLLNCELCSLAYEGLAEADPAEFSAGVSAITEAAWERVAALEKRKRRGAFIWMSTAASILILIVAGYFVLDRPADPSLDGLAQQMLERSDETGASAPTDVNSGNFAETRPPAPPPEEELLPDPTLKNELLDAKTNAKENSALFLKETNQELTLGANRDQKELADQDLEPSVMADAEETIDYYGGGFMDNGSVNTAPIENSNNGLSFTPAPKISGKDYKNLESKSDFNSAMDTATVLQWSNAQTPGDRINNVDLVQVDEVSEDDSFADDFDGFDADKDVEELAEMEEVVAAVEAPRQQPVSTSSTILLEKAETRKDEVGTMSGGVLAADEPAVYGNASSEKTMGSASNKPQKAKRNRLGRKGKISDPSSTPPSRDKAEQAPPVEANEFKRGMDAYREKDFAQASVNLRQAASETPDNLEAHLFAARSFLEVKQPTAALYHLNRILAAPGNSYLEDAKWFKSIALLQLGDQKGAKVLLEELEAAGGKRSGTAKEVLDQF